MNAITSSSLTVDRARMAIRWSVLLALVTLAACDRPDLAAPTAPLPAVSSVSPEISWASGALARNPNLEVLATDSAAGVFTIRVKTTGEVRAVKLADLAASPIAELAQSAQATRAAAPEMATPAVPPGAPITETPANAPIAPKAAVAATKRDDTAVASPVAPAVTSSGDTTRNYTIERDGGGQLKVSGPGVSIVSSGMASASSTTGMVERNPEPVICEGQRLLHLDNRVISAGGNGVIARDGCELYITNSHITALGTAVIVGDAIVHIANSTIEGNTASFDADDRARMFVRSSTFKGVSRRAEQAVIQDQGGNRWQ